MGKGGKTRPVLLPASLWTRLQALRGPRATPTDPVFLSRKGGPLQPRQLHDIVKNACRRVGLPNVSAHWFRHSHWLREPSPSPRFCHCSSS